MSCCYSCRLFQSPGLTNKLLCFFYLCHFIYLESFIAMTTMIKFGLFWLIANIKQIKAATLHESHQHWLFQSKFRLPRNYVWRKHKYCWWQTKQNFQVPNGNTKIAESYNDVVAYNISYAHLKWRTIIFHWNNIYPNCMSTFLCWTNTKLVNILIDSEWISLT